jgi:hypothetical protein
MQFHRTLRKSIIAVLLVTALTACKVVKAQNAQGASTSGSASADNPRPTNSAHDFVLSLQQALRRGDRSWVIGMTRFPVTVGEINTRGEINTSLDKGKEEYLRAHQKITWDQATYTRDYDKVWNPQTVKAVMDENADHVTWEPGALAENIGCGEVWFRKAKDGSFRIAEFDISLYRIAGMSLQDCYGVRAFVKNLQTAVADNRRNQIAGMLKYPLRYHGAHKTIILHGARETLHHYDLIFSPRLRRAIAKQQIWDLGAMADGVSIGYGFIWISDPSQKGQFKITSIFEPAIDE